MNNDDFKKIDSLKEKMYELLDKNIQINDVELLKISQELDILIFRNTKILFQRVL